MLDRRLERLEMIRTLEISNADFVKVDPAEDHRAFHKQSIINLRKRINKGLASRKFPISSFDSFTSEMDIESHLSGVGASILEAYRNKQFFDFGIVDDNAIKSLSSETNTRPIATPPWDGQSAVFAAFHPDTIGYNCTSLYIMQLLDDQIIVLTEAGYYQEHDRILVMGSMASSFPLSWEQEIRLIGGVEGAENLGPSIVNPVLMGCAFLRKDFSDARPTLSRHLLFRSSLSVDRKAESCSAANGGWRASANHRRSPRAPAPLFSCRSGR